MSQPSPAQSRSLLLRVLLFGAGLMLLGLGIYFGFRVPPEEEVAESGPARPKVAEHPTLRFRTDPDEAQASAGPDPRDGSLRVHVIGPDGESLPGARVQLIPMDAAHQATAPECACPQEVPRVAEAEEAEAPSFVSALGSECAFCAPNAEALLELAERGVGFLPEREERTGPEGLVRFSGLALHGSYALWVEAPPLAPGTALGLEASPAADEEADPVEVELQPPATARVKVVDRAGRPVPGVRLAGFVEAPFRPVSFAPKGELFAASGPGLPRDSVLVVAVAEGYLPGQTWVSAGDGDDEPETLTLSQPRALRGRALHRGEPVAGAQVSAREEESGFTAEVTTDRQGQFRLRDAPAGHYELSARAGALHGTLQVEVSAYEEPAPVELELVESARLTGRVVDAATGKPVPEAEVELSGDGSSDTTATTDAQGQFSLEEVAPGAYTLKGSEADHLPESQPLTLTEGEAAQVELRLQAGLVLRGRVVDGRGQPVADARIVDQVPGNADEPGDGRWFAHTAEDGAFELHGLPAGPQVLVVSADDHPELTEPVSLPTGELLLRLADGAVVEGLVLGPHGPVEGAQVQLLSVNRRGGEAQTESDAQGRFRVAGLAPGELEVSASAQGLAACDPVQLTAREGPPVRVELHLGEGLSLSGVVVDDQGRPVPEATVEAYPAAPPGRGGLAALSVSGSSDPEGHFKLGGLRSGEYRLFAYREGLSQPTPATAAAGSSSVRLELSRSGRVSGRVVNARGEPVHRFTVEGEEFQTPDGAFTLREVAPETVELVVEGEFQPRRVPLKVKAGEQVDVGTVQVDEGLALRGRVVGPDGRPAPGAQVLALPASFVEEGGAPERDSAEELPAEELDGQHSATPDAQGGFSLLHLRPARYALVATSGAGASRQVLAQAGGAAVELRLEAAGELKGSFHYADGAPVSDGVVDVTVGTVTQQGRVVGGAFRVTGVPAGRAHIVGLALGDRFHQSVAQAELEVGAGAVVQLELRAAAEEARAEQPN